MPAKRLIFSELISEIGFERDFLGKPVGYYTRRLSEQEDAYPVDEYGSCEQHCHIYDRRQEICVG